MKSSCAVFLLVLFTMPIVHSGPTFESVDEILRSDHTNVSYTPVPNCQVFRC